MCACFSNNNRGVFCSARPAAEGGVNDRTDADVIRSGKRQKRTSVDRASNEMGFCFILHCLFREGVESSSSPPERRGGQTSSSACNNDPQKFASRVSVIFAPLVAMSARRQGETQLDAQDSNRSLGSFRRTLYIFRRRPRRIRDARPRARSLALLMFESKL